MDGVGPELEEAALGVTRNDLDQLKQTAPSVISEVLLKKVLDINQVSVVLSLARNTQLQFFIPHIKRTSCAAKFG